MSIPKIGLLDAIVEGVNSPQLEQGPGHYPGTPLPGEAGNVAIAGHRTTYAHPFYNLNNLSLGDPIYILTGQGLFRYRVVNTQVVSPSDTAILDSTSDSPTLTLTTCNPRYSASTRLVVTAALSPGPGQKPTTAPTTPTTLPPAPKYKVIPGDATGTTAGDALSGSTTSYWPGILWGAATLAIAIAFWQLRRRTPVRWRWAVAIVAIPGALLCLLLCFEHVSLALPGSF